MASPSDAALSRLATINQRRLDVLAKRVGEQNARAFTALGNVDDAALARWLDFTVPYVEAAQASAATMQASYVELIASQMGAGEPTAALVLDDVIGSAARSGVAMREVYERPVIAARKALADGLPWRDAMAIGARRARELARTDVATSARLASVDACRRTPGVVGYRRVPSSRACPFCLTIATQRYHDDELAPAHPDCTCGVVPITGTRDPGRVIAAEARQTLDAQGTSPSEVAASAEIVDTESGPTVHAEPQE